MNCTVSISVLCLALFFAAAVPAAAEPRVVGFSPEGTVKEVRQVTARFSEPMVALGDPRSASDPFATILRPTRLQQNSTWPIAQT